MRLSDGPEHRVARPRERLVSAREARRRMRRNRRASRRRCISSASGARGCPRWRSSRCRRATACPAPTRGLARSSTPSAKPEPRASSSSRRRARRRRETGFGRRRARSAISVFARARRRARRRGADPRRPAGFGRGVQRRPRRQRARRRPPWRSARRAGSYRVSGSDARAGARRRRGGKRAVGHDARHVGARAVATSPDLSGPARGHRARVLDASTSRGGGGCGHARQDLHVRGAGRRAALGRAGRERGGRGQRPAVPGRAQRRRRRRRRLCRRGGRVRRRVPRARTRHRGVAERGARPPGHVQRRARSGGHVRAVRAPRPPRRARRGVWGRRERPRARRDARGSGRRFSGRFSGRSSGSSRRGGGFVRDLRVRRRQRVARGGRARGRAHGRVLVHRHAQRRVRVGDVRPGDGRVRRAQRVGGVRRRVRDSSPRARRTLRRDRPTRSVARRILSDARGRRAADADDRRDGARRGVRRLRAPPDGGASRDGGDQRAARGAFWPSRSSRTRVPGRRRCSTRSPTRSAGREAWTRSS